MNEFIDLNNTPVWLALTLFIWLITATMILIFQITWYMMKKFGSSTFEKRQQDESLDMIEKHGMGAYLYLGPIRSEGIELSIAIAKLDHSGYIFTDKKGFLLGKFVKARLSNDEIAAERRRTFKLVD